MSKIIDYIAAICAISAFPLFLYGVKKLFRENVKDMEKRRTEKKNISDALHNMHYGEHDYSHEKGLVHHSD